MPRLNDMLTLIPPFGDIFFYPLARSPTAIFLRPCGLACPSRRYSFGLAASLAPHGDISLALRPRLPLTVIFLWPRSPLMAIFLWPCGLACSLSAIFLRPCGLARPSREYSFGLAASLAPSRQNRFSIHLTASVDFIFLMPPHFEIDFLFASRRMYFYYSSASLRRYFIRPSRR